MDDILHETPKLRYEGLTDREQVPYSTDNNSSKSDFQPVAYGLWTRLSNPLRFLRVCLLSLKTWCGSESFTISTKNIGTFGRCHPCCSVVHLAQKEQSSKITSDPQIVYGTLFLVFNFDGQDLFMIIVIFHFICFPPLSQCLLKPI